MFHGSDLHPYVRTKEDALYPQVERRESKHSLPSTKSASPFPFQLQLPLHLESNKTGVGWSVVSSTLEEAQCNLAFVLHPNPSVVIYSHGRQQIVGVVTHNRANHFSQYKTTKCSNSGTMTDIMSMQKLNEKNSQHIRVSSNGVWLYTIMSRMTPCRTYSEHSGVQVWC
jgi:hypothetical protein